MNPYIYLRGLRRADHTVFVVQDGQKTYRDPMYPRVSLPYSSGQQVKRSILEGMTAQLGEKQSPTTFVFNVNTSNQLGEGEVLSVCDPAFADQLIGGWMSAVQGGESRTIKRRSPLSISAMRPLHPLLASANDRENLTFDRSDKPGIHKVVVRNSNGEILTDEQVVSFLEGTDRSLRRKWIPDNRRATGLFVYDIAIDLRTLFSVSTNEFEPELAKATKERLKSEGWLESENAFGPCLLCPKERREEIIPALAHALINWRITTNQARTYSPQETLAVAISDNANRIAGTIRAKLNEEDENKARPIVDENIPDTDVFVTLACAGYIAVHSESYDALDKAEAKLTELMLAFDYENQLAK
ncbi:CRISPR-associated protein Cas7 [Telluribacter sp.]|jgi:hypothetical protein|uniref:CRISPR-associated protein Cas7 n=1 Tax=Telluribacter sp. TaxID=1978767 RepID=UPI002E160E19|nr:CRISPR-associated protein Cas7 [Telluribacter sp.]